MIIYRINFYDAHEGQLVEWVSSEVEANRRLKGLQKNRGEPAIGPEGVEKIDFPTDKKGLLAWLNTHFTTDNG